MRSYESLFDELYWYNYIFVCVARRRREGCPNSAILRTPNWSSCAQLTKQNRNTVLFWQILLSNIAVSSALTAVTASAKHFGVKIIKYLAVLCINAAVTGVTISNCNKFLISTRSVTSVVSWRQKRQRFIELCWPPVENNTIK